jgi:Holliday junction DNA helicase RuvA
MIGYIEGEIVHKDERSRILLTSGIGYVIFVTGATLALVQPGEQMRFWTHLAVREDALDLYGFFRREELLFFRLLIGISGIGPKSAQNVLSLADIRTLTHAIRSGDASYLTKVSGIGKKLGEKIILELKDKLSEFAVGETEISNAETEAILALEALGYAPRDTRELVRTLTPLHHTTEAIIKKALQKLGGRG